VTNRFNLRWEKLAPAVSRLRTEFTGNYQSVLEAFNAAVDEKWIAANPTELFQNLRLVCDSSLSPAWPFFNTLSALVKGNSVAVREAVVKLSSIPTETPNEFLRLESQGVWQVAWHLLEKPSDNEEDIPALNWHDPSNPSRTPITPQPLIDYIGGCVSLYRANLLLPSFAVLTMAYESALWDALVLAGEPRTTNKVSYKQVMWKFRKLRDNLVAEIVGADDSLVNCPLTGAQAEVRLTNHLIGGGSESELTIKINPGHVPFFATRDVLKQETVSSRGLRNAVELARARKIKPISVIPKPLDATFIAIRNNLVHFPASGKLDTPIPLLEGEITDVSALAEDKRLFVKLLLPVIALINAVYAEPVSIPPSTEVPAALPTTTPVAAPPPLAVPPASADAQIPSAAPANNT
jgi:hypothetical protein